MVLGQQMGDGSIYVTECGVRRQDRVKGASGKTIKAALRERYRDWSPEVSELLQAVDQDRITPRLLFMLPVGMRWETRPGVTSPGDAAHLMMLFTGEGVNSAMIDAMAMTHTIAGAIKDGQDKEKLYRRIEMYELEMFERITPVQATTENVMKLMFFTNGASRTLIELWILALVSDELNGVVLVVAKMMVYIYYFCFQAVLLIDGTPDLLTTGFHEPCSLCGFSLSSYPHVEILWYLGHTTAINRRIDGIRSSFFNRSSGFAGNVDVMPRCEHCSTRERIPHEDTIYHLCLCLAWF